MTSLAGDAQSTARPEHSRFVAILVHLVRITARARLAQFIAIGSAIFALALDPAKTAEVTARVIEDRMLFAELGDVPIVEEAWSKEIAAAEAALDPCHFTSFIGYEWTNSNRWSVFDCQSAPSINPTGCAAGGKLNVQIAERAWTSPVWYLP